LEDLLLVRRLLPWSGNLAKRLIRTPKLYIRDSGLLHGLLELESLHDLLGHPVVGASWEGFVIETLIAAAGPGMRPLYYRTQDGAEIDLAFERGGKPEFAIEIKRSSAPKIEPGFAIACNDLGVTNRLCIAPVEASYPTRGGVMVMPLLEAVARLKQRS
jgi:predicted AAA+ superfamily ATPase